MTPGPRQTTIISIQSSTRTAHNDEDDSPSDGAHTDNNDDEGFTVQTTPSSPSSVSSTRRGSILFPRRPPGSSVGAVAGGGPGRPELGLARSTTLSTPLTAVPNIRKFQDIFSRRRSTTPSSSKGTGGDGKVEEGVTSNGNDGVGAAAIDGPLAAEAGETARAEQIDSSSASTTLATGTRSTTAG